MLYDFIQVLYTCKNLCSVTFNLIEYLTQQKNTLKMDNKSKFCYIIENITSNYSIGKFIQTADWTASHDSCSVVLDGSQRSIVFVRPKEFCSLSNIHIKGVTLMTDNGRRYQSSKCVAGHRTFLQPWEVVCRLPSWILLIPNRPEVSCKMLSVNSLRLCLLHQIYFLKHCVLMRKENDVDLKPYLWQQHSTWKEALCLEITLNTIVLLITIIPSYIYL